MTADLPGVDRLPESLLDHAQGQLLLGRLAVVGQDLDLFAQPAPLLETLAELGPGGAEPLLHLVAPGFETLLGGALQIAAERLQITVAGDGRVDLPLDRLPLLLQPFHPGQLGRPGVELLLALDARRVQQLPPISRVQRAMALACLIFFRRSWRISAKSPSRRFKSDCCSSSRRTISRIWSVAWDDESLTFGLGGNWRMRPQIASSSRLRC